MAKQKQDNKTVDIELLILRDKIECLIDDYEKVLTLCVAERDKEFHNTVVENLKDLLEN